MANENQQVLSGIRVLEWSDKRAVRLVGMFLAEQGAEVVIVNPDNSQKESSEVSTILNRGKTYLSHDFRSVSDLAPLVNSVDLLITHRTTQSLGNSGLDCGRIRNEANPGLISCSIPAYSSEDASLHEEWAEEEVSVAAGLYESPSGLGKPTYFDLPIASTYAAFHAVNAIVMALIERKRSSFGQHIEIPVVNAAKTLQLILFMIQSKPPTRWMPFQMLASPFMGIYEAAQKEHVYLHIAIPRHLRSFTMHLDKVGFGEEKKQLKRAISKETRYEPSMVKGIREAAAITKILKRMFKKRDAIYWEEWCSNAGLCCVKIRTVEDWLAHPQAIQSGDVSVINDEKNISINVPGKLIERGVKDSLSGQQARLESISSKELLNQWQTRNRDVKEEKNESQPLSGVRVLDFSRVIAGPYAGKQLAEYGAEVLQVTFRKSHIIWEEPFLVAFGGGKDSIIVDLTSADGRETFRKIVKKFEPDIVIHNFSQKVAKKLQIDETYFKTINPRCIYCSIFAYNNKGPWHDRVGLEWNIQAATGLVTAYSKPNKPAILNIPINDLCAGIITSYGTALSYYQLLTTGRTQSVTTYLSSPSLYLLIDKFNKPSDNSKSVCSFYKAKDGWFLFRIDKSIVETLTTIKEFAPLRKMTGQRWDKALQDILKKKTLYAWRELISSVISDGRVVLLKRVKIRELLQEELKNKKGLFHYKSHVLFGNLLVARSPVSLERTPLRDVHAAHYFGMDTKQYYAGVSSQLKIPDLKIDTQEEQKNSIFDRIIWTLKQLKWILVILYRKS